MKRYGILLIIGMMLSINSHAQTERESSPSIQTAFTTGREAAFGRITPATIGTVGNALINPASLGGIGFSQLAMSTYDVSGYFNYRHISFAFPLKEMVFGLTYGTNVSNGFTKTLVADDRIYDVGSFKAGFDMVHVGFGQRTHQGLFFIDHFYYGFGLGALQQVIDTDRRAPAISLDTGFIARIFVNSKRLEHIDIGASVIGAFSTKLPRWQLSDATVASDEQAMLRQIFAGANFIGNNMLITSGVYLQNVAIRDVMLGGAYTLADIMTLRGSVTYDPSQEKSITYHIGTGLVLERVAGIGNQIYDLSIDYGATIYSEFRSVDPSHTISVAFMGQTANNRPVVLSPKSSFETADATVNFDGQAQPNVTVFMYNNDQLIGHTKANSRGKWAIENTPLAAGYNTVVFRSGSKTNTTSSPSIPIVIHRDLTPPTTEKTAYIDNDNLKIGLFSSEPLSKAELIGDGTYRFKKTKTDNYYEVTLPIPQALRSFQPIPEKMVDYTIAVYDASRNKAPTASISLFIEPIFPLDKTVVYADTITAMGRVSPLVDALTVNTIRVNPDRNHAFAQPLGLGYGKQLVRTDVVFKNGQRIQYYARLLCLRRFEDIPASAPYRRDVELLATMGYVHGLDDGLFHPNDTMTRRDVVLAIAKQQNLAPKTVLYDPFLDVSKNDPDAGLLAASVEAGIAYAFADGTFKPDDPMSVEDAFKMVLNADLIDSDDIVINPNPIKRYEFALFFKQVRRYEQRVQYLLDWDQGYVLPTP
jgi:hypothetical protein